MSIAPERCRLVFEKLERDLDRLSARSSDFAAVVQHLLASPRSVLGAGGEGNQDGPLCGRPGGAMPMATPGEIHAEAEAIPGATAGDCQ